MKNPLSAITELLNQGVTKPKETLNIKEIILQIVNKNKFQSP
jgi:hypothetical protein